MTIAAHDPAPLPPGQPSASARAASSPAPAWTEMGTSAYRRISIALFLAGFSTFSLIYSVQPLLPNLVETFGVTPSQSSLALSLSTGCLAFAILCAGALGERFSRRGLMCASMIAAALLQIACAFTTNWHLLLALRALEGLALGGVPAVAMAYLAEEIHPRSLGAAMGVYIGGTGVGGMMGRVGMGLVTEFSSWRVALGVLGVVGLLAAIGFVRLLPPSRNFAPRRGVSLAQHRRAWLGHLATPGLPLLFLTGFLALGIQVAMFNYLTFRLSGPPYALSEGQISAMFVVFLFGVAASTLAGSAADRHGRGPVLIGGILTIMLGVALTTLSHLALIVVGVIAVTIGFFITHSVASGWVGRMAKGSKGHASSLYLLAYYAGSSVLGTLGGAFWSAGQWPAVAGFVAVLLVIALGAALRLAWTERAARRRLAL